jgi:4-hydroxy-tetrahydrodipicolinate synthase
VARDAFPRAPLVAARARPVVAGTGHNATRRAAAQTARAKELGCAGALVVTPYYNKPTQRGLAEHFRAVAEAAAGFPLIAYNVPGRTAVNMTPATVRELWKLDSVVAIKESSGDLAQISEVARTLPQTKLLLAGDDSLGLPSIAAGAEGLVSVVANVLPGPTARLVAAARAGRRAEAGELQAKLLPVIDALFCEPSPIPLKAALRELGIAGDRLRLPLTSPEPETRARIADVLRPFRE